MRRPVPRPFHSVLRILACFSLALTLLGGCAYKNALERGDQAMAAQRYEDALGEYEAALKLKPDSAEARQKLAAARAEAVGLRIAAARTKLAAKDLHGAIAEAAGALTLRADSPEVVGLVDEVLAAVIREGERHSGAGHHAEAVALYDTAVIGLPGERARIEAPRQATLTRWIAALDIGAKAAEDAGRQGDALLQRAMMVELGDAGATGDRDRLREALRATLMFRVRQTGPVRDGAFTELGQRLTGLDPVRWIEVLAPNAPAPEAAATLSFSLPKPRFAAGKSSRSETARYQSATRQIPNPFYKSAQDRVKDRERAVLEAEKEVTEQERYVGQYTQDVAREGDTPTTSTGAEQNLNNARSRLESARNKVNAERDQLQQARDDLARTQESSEEPVFSTLDYKITTHVITATTRLVATITGRNGVKTELAKDLLETAGDETHEAQSVADIPADPLELPPPETLEAKLREAAFAELTTRIGGAFAAYRQSLLDAANQATSDDDRADKLVRYMVVDSSASDPAIDEAIWKLRGIPEASARLRRLTAAR